MGRCKQWLYGKFLPAWCREELLAENARLRSEVESRGREIERLHAYIGGMEAALLRQSRIVIKAREVTRP